MSAKVDVPTPAPLRSGNEIQTQIERILRSDAFRGSEILRNLLSYLFSCALEGRSEPLKVREIATAVFGRSENFDSQTDSVVRVHAGRLRSKLAEYYMSEGVEDDLVVTIPKGGYDLSWHSRHLATPLGVAPSDPASPEHSSFSRVENSSFTGDVTPHTSISTRVAVVLLAVAIVVTALAAGFFLRNPRPATVTPGLNAFWAPFISSSETPLMVFSNFRLVGSISSTLQKYSGPSETETQVIDTYTTMGEVMGVFEVTRLLTSWGKPVRTKRGKLLTWDEAKDSNLIFIGGPLAETPLRDVKVLNELQFQDGPFSAEHKGGAVINLHPRKGEDPVYYGSDAFAGDSRSSFDYAVIALRPALSRGHSILVLAGITEFGTQAAAEYVTREEHVTELLARLARKAGGPAPWFEALLRVQIEGGVPVQSSIVLVHQVN
jgi:DNA-binding winged helix-turn-helix (wHTH) protein